MAFYQWLQPGKKRPLSFFAVFPLLLLLVISAARYSAQGSTALEIEGVPDEELVDEDGDTLYEYLSISVSVVVYEPGSYGIYGSLLNDQVVSNFGPVPLEIGRHELELRFSGGSILSAGIDGHYPFKIELYSTDATLDPVVETFTTEETYSANSFEAPLGSGQVYVESRGDKVFIIGDVMTLAVNQTYPQISFYYTKDQGERSKSSITYEKIVAFNDINGDGIWERSTDEERYEGDLSMVDWTLDLDVKTGYDISLYGVVQLRLVGTSTYSAWAKVTFRLRSEQLLYEGASQKFDIDIDLWQPLDAEYFALQHVLRDETGSKEIKEGSGSTVSVNDPYVLTVVGEKDRTWGIYSWSDDIRTGDIFLDKDDQAVSWYAIGTEEASVWFSYPLEGDVQLIHHDPVLGMDPENVIGPDDEPDFLEDRPLIMLLGLAIGVLVVGVTVLMRSRFFNLKGGGS
jgi:hypothetical protein